MDIDKKELMQQANMELQSFACLYLLDFSDNSKG